MRIRRCSVFASVVAAVAAMAGFVPSAGAGIVPGAVTFDFDAIPIPRGQFAISDYMTDVYGSTVRVEGARTIGETFLADDVFIATSFQLFNRGDFDIFFDEVPIIGLQFEAHVIDATFRDDFVLRAFSGDTEVFSLTRDDGVDVFPVAWIDFDQPVDRINISDSGRKDVGVDDLVVQAVPEPATWLLAGGGTVALLFRRRRW